MIDHIGLSVADYQKSKAFYLAALAPLGYELFMEIPEAGPHAGFAAGGFNSQPVALKGIPKARSSS